MRKALGIAVLACVFCANTCWAGPFGLEMGDKTAAFPAKRMKLEQTLPDGRKCYIWNRPVIAKEVPGNFRLFFGKAGLSEMSAMSAPTPDRKQAEAYFHSIYKYISGFGGRGQRADGVYMDYSKVHKNGEFDVIWSDFASDPVLDEDAPELCKMGLKMERNKEKMYIVTTYIIYRNSKFCGK